MKKLVAWSVFGACVLVPTVAAPLAIALGKHAVRTVSPGHIYEDWFFGQMPGFLNFSRVTSSKQLETLPSLTDFYNKRMVIGTYSEQREFYTTLSTDAYHYGMDILVPAGTPVYSPYDAELIYATFINKSEAITTANEGVGGVAVLRVKVSDMANLSDEEKAELLSKLNDKGLGKDSKGVSVDYVYIQLFHMSSAISLINGARTSVGSTGAVSFVKADGVSVDTPLRVKQGSLLGFVGSVEENGGWAPHIHYQLMNPANEKSRVSADGKVSATGIIKLVYGEPDNLSTLRVVGVGPRVNITNGTILDANVLLKVLRTVDGSYKIPPQLIYATTYSVIDPEASKDIAVSLPFALGNAALPVIEKLPPGPQNFSEWSAPVYVRSGRTGTFDPASLALGDKFTVAYTKTRNDGTAGSYRLTATYTAINKKPAASFFATYFHVKGNSFSPQDYFVPEQPDRYEPWLGPVISKQANTVFKVIQISGLTSGTFTETYSSSPLLANERYVVTPS